MRRLLVFVFLATSAIAGRAAAAPTPWDEYRERRWQMSDGLPQATVRSLVQAENGVLWLATTGGIVAFDGASFSTYDDGDNLNLGSPDIRTLLFDRKQRLWVGLSGGAGLALHTPNGVRSMREPLSLKGNAVISALKDSRGRRWLGTWLGPLLIPQDGARAVTVGSAPGVPYGQWPNRPRERFGLARSRTSVSATRPRVLNGRA